MIRRSVGRKASKKFPLFKSVKLGASKDLVYPGYEEQKLKLFAPEPAPRPLPKPGIIEGTLEISGGLLSIGEIQAASMGEAYEKKKRENPNPTPGQKSAQAQKTHLIEGNWGKVEGMAVKLKDPKDGPAIFKNGIHSYFEGYKLPGWLTLRGLDESTLFALVKHLESVQVHRVNFLVLPPSLAIRALSSSADPKISAKRLFYTAHMMKVFNIAGTRSNKIERYFENNPGVFEKTLQHWPAIEEQLRHTRVDLRSLRFILIRINNQR